MIDVCEEDCFSLTGEHPRENSDEIIHRLNRVYVDRKKPNHSIRWNDWMNLFDLVLLLSANRMSERVLIDIVYTMMKHMDRIDEYLYSMIDWRREQEKLIRQKRISSGKKP